MVDHIPLMHRLRLPIYEPIFPVLTNIGRISVALSLIKDDDEVKRFQHATDYRLLTDVAYQQALLRDDHEQQLDRLEYLANDTAEHMAKNPTTDSGECNITKPL